MNAAEYIMGVAIALYTLAAVVFLILLRRAPFGYEDERGFHYGTKPDGEDRV
jgi:hypothetical protein